MTTKQPLQILARFAKIWKSANYYYGYTEKKRPMPKASALIHKLEHHIQHVRLDDLLSPSGTTIFGPLVHLAQAN